MRYKKNVSVSDFYNYLIVRGYSSLVNRKSLMEIFEMPLKYAKLFQTIPLRLPRGVLLYGPPGCGKTKLAQAVAGECGLNFISIKGPEILGKYIGQSEQVIIDIFIYYL